jgi:predicted RecA/RadA family phage recombinase
VKDGADTASHTFVGVADQSKSNAGAADGAEEVKAWKTGVFEFVAASATQAWVGVTVYIVDNQTVALAATTTNDIAVGKVVALISATKVRVRIDGFAF